MNLRGTGDRWRALATMRPVPSRDFHPDLPLLRTHDIAARGGHVLHVREWGSSEGIPALVLHGGPGSGSSPMLWRAFDPARFRVIAPDQRGAGRSTPRGRVEHNTTADLLADLRALRRTLGIERWLVVGGSWGATLALAHVLDEPAAASGLLMRASFVSRCSDIARFFDAPPPHLAAAWQAFRAAVGPAQGQSILQALYQALVVSDDAERARALTLAWWRWERSLASGHADTGTLDGEALTAQFDRLRVQAHYLRASCWLDEPNLLQRAEVRPPRVPVLLVHGRDDDICPPACAAQLHAAMPASRLQWIPGAGHDPTHPAMVDAMVGALDTWAVRSAWPQAIPA